MSSSSADAIHHQPFPATVAESVPSTPVNQVNQAGWQTAEPQRPQFGAYERGRIVPGANREAGVTPHTVVELGLDTELELFDSLEEIVSFLDKSDNKDALSLLSEVMKEKMVDLRDRAAALSLERKDIEERKAIEEEYEEAVRQTARQRLGFNYEARNRTTRDDKLKKLNKKIERRRKAIEEYNKTRPGETPTPGEKPKKVPRELEELISDHNLGLSDLTPEDLKTRLEAYLKKDRKPLQIFDNLTDVMQAYSFLESAEKIVALQAGQDITDGGRRPVEFDFSDATINRVAQAGVPNTTVQALRDIGRRIRIGDVFGVQELIAGLSVGTVEALMNAHNFWPAPGDAAQAGAAFALGVGSMLFVRAVGRRMNHWRLSFPPERAEQRTQYTLQFHFIQPPPGDGGNPLRRMYGGDARRAEQFLQAIDNVRVDIANKLKVHPGQLEGWLNLSSAALGESVEGMEFPHRVVLAKNIEQILAQEHRNATGGHIPLEELSAEEQIEVIERAFDGVALAIGGEAMDDVTKNAAIRRMMGEVNWAQRRNVLATHVAEIRAGTRVYHASVTPHALEEARTQFEAAEKQEARQSQGKDAYGAKYTELQNQLRTLETARIELENISTINGHITRDVTVKGRKVHEDASGEIGVLEAEKTRIDGEITKLKGEIDATNANGLEGQYKQAKRRYETLHGKVEALKSKKQAAQAEIDTLQRGRDRAKAAKIAQWESIRDQAEQNLTTAPSGQKTLEEQEDDAYLAFVPLKDQYEPKTAEVGRLQQRQNAIPGEIQAFERAIAEKEKLYRVAQLNYTLAQKEVLTILQDFGYKYTPAQLRSSSLRLPTSQMITDKYTELHVEYQVKQNRLTELVRLAEAGVSEEDLRIATLIETLSGVVGSDRLNSFMQQLLSRGIKLEDLANTQNNEGYHLMLKFFFGEDALTQGKDGKYARATTLLSKARLCDEAFKIWRIDDRASGDGFFAGDDEGLQLYQNARFIFETNRRLTQEVFNLENAVGQTPATIALIERRRREIAANEVKRNETLSQLYDSRIAPLLSLDRVRTGMVVMQTFQKLSDDALNGFVELTPSPSGAHEELVTTSAGRMVITEASHDTLTRTVIERGALKTENIEGVPGVSIEMHVTSLGTPGRLDTTVVLDRDQGVGDRIANRNSADTPDEIRYIFHGEPNRRREFVDTAAFTDDLWNLLPDQRGDARRLGVPNEFLDWVYGVNSSGGTPKRPVAELRTSAINMSNMPDVRGNFRGVPLEMQDFFYYYDDARRRATVDLNTVTDDVIADIGPADRRGALASGLPQEFVDLFYNLDTPGTVRSLADVQTALGTVTDAMLQNLPDSRVDALSEGYPQQFVDFFYGSDIPGGKRTVTALENMAGTATLDATQFPSTAQMARNMGWSNDVVNLLYDQASGDLLDDDGLTDLLENRAQDLLNVMGPADRNAAVGMPQSLIDIVYAENQPGRKRVAANVRADAGTITPALLGALPADRQGARTEDYPDEIVRLFYEADRAGTKRNLAEVQAALPGAAFRIDQLPELGNALINGGILGTDAWRFFYNQVTDIRRTNRSIDVFIEGLPDDRVNAPPGFGTALDVLYDATSGKKRSLQDLRKIPLHRQGTFGRVESLLDNLGMGPIVYDQFAQEITMGVAQMDAVSQSRLLGDRFQEVVAGNFRVYLMNGQLGIYFRDPPDPALPERVSHRMSLHQFIQADTYPPEVGAYLTQNPGIKRGILINTAPAIIEAVRNISV
ncbi:hypothetical protein HYW55_06025 [Candidatus Gottesmanbacteria bacterium]|nr:hypothetical protein [Candidatus Gottesmanbacteria bacterium]